jgi:hypothetical protein
MLNFRVSVASTICEKELDRGDVYRPWGGKRISLVDYRMARINYSISTQWNLKGGRSRVLDSSLHMLVVFFYTKDD